MRHDFTPDLAVWRDQLWTPKNSLGTSSKTDFIPKELKLNKIFKDIITKNYEVPVYLIPNH